MAKRRMTTEEALKKYSNQIGNQVGDFNKNPVKFNPRDGVSQEYSHFKADMMPELSRYEKWAHSLGNFIKFKMFKSSNFTR